MAIKIEVILSTVGADELRSMTLDTTDKFMDGLFISVKQHMLCYIFRDPDTNTLGIYPIHTVIIDEKELSFHDIFLMAVKYTQDEVLAKLAELENKLASLKETEDGN